MRPPSTAPRTARLALRLYTLEKKAIELAAAKSGMKISAYLREAALGKNIKPRFSQDELELRKILVEYRNNFARISNLVKHKKDFTLPLQELIKAIDLQLKRFHP